MLENKKIGICFFVKDGKFDKRAIGKGVYSIQLKIDGISKPETLYVGQSVWMIVRCAGHLYRIFNTPEYMGLTEADLDNENFKLIFGVEKPVEGKNERRDEEIKYIKELKPLTQGTTSDKQFNNKLELVQNKIKELLS